MTAKINKFCPLMKLPCLKDACAWWTILRMTDAGKEIGNCVVHWIVEEIA